MRLHAYIILICVVGMLSHTFGKTHVRGYYRKNGTYVAPHVRSSPSRSSRGYGSSSGGSYFYGGSRTGSAREDTNYDNMMETLKNCQAPNDDGTPCRRRALPGKTYCYLHVGYKPPKANVSKSLSPKDIQRDSEMRKETLARIDSLRIAIQRYRGKGGPPPISIGQISSATNDAWGRPFCYETDGKDYAIASDGGDGKPNTFDDILFVSNEQPKCQAVLPDGKICGATAESKKWYCPKHAADDTRKTSSAKTPRQKSVSNEIQQRPKVSYKLDVILILIAAAWSACGFCLSMMQEKPRV